MTRIALTDGSGKWFDTDKAVSYPEGKTWDGHNHISCATGAWGEHECLYRTASKRWILNHWSNWVGTTETYEEISDDCAAKWLVKNGAEHPDVASIIADLEV